MTFLRETLLCVAGGPQLTQRLPLCDLPASSEARAALRYFPSGWCVSLPCLAAFESRIFVRLLLVHM